MLQAQVLQLVDPSSRSIGYPAAIGELQVDSGLSESVIYVLVLYSS